uniref:Sulfotransferase domain-containing protein n=1 Tax=Odontella aurita TaxID=265563 RepID=A0A7S4N7Y2_9STRA|mmetsp:Transcript_51143/g.153659  ORF Transcript_51143/g.153659 Transcript_51143/m.153659 type:complete len:344 (+) Transcript_51143:237-1268(+)|eukprot:CAMPEP_0113569242 /NCGR_PEP_ID=MMETSP0015_2-20120614/24296_1 /TAXON_ID=2838 /ORGANISM="Odontella" /LENGTH=343 /DNA_ID=CAMNT_0000471873 /DNA_START=126 /DNA_END=1157 /DNA_ORIENTATION=- /assembly_acc=CAM_ASM_000160
MSGAGGGGAMTSTLSEMPLLSITSPETVELCKSLPLQDGDVFICSYPKSGTTWTQHIVLSLLMRHRRNKAAAAAAVESSSPPAEPLKYDHVSDYAPFYEVDRHWNVEHRDLIDSIRENHDRLGRRVFNTHLRWDMLPRSSPDASTYDGAKRNAKFIYLVRSPLDVCVSFYYHLSHQEEGRYTGTFDEFFREWIRGKIAFGSWIDHVLSYAPSLSSSRDDVLFVSYEEMLSDTRTTATALAKFLSARVSDSDLDEMLPTFSFASMKSDLDKFRPRSVAWRNDFQFLRRGVSGDSRTAADDEQRGMWRERLEREDFEGRLRCILKADDERDDDGDALEKILGLLS